MSKKILFVDDEPHFVRAHIEALEGEGYVVVQAKDGNEALERLESSEYDLIILDIIMPPGDLGNTNDGLRTGLRIHEIIRRQLCLTTPILFLTVVGSQEDHQHIRYIERECGRPRPPILVKPVLPSELVEHSEMLMGTDYFSTRGKI